MEILRKQLTPEQHEKGEKASLDLAKVLLGIAGLVTATVAFGDAALGWYYSVEGHQKHKSVEKKAEEAKSTAAKSYEVLVVQQQELLRRLNQMDEDMRYLMRNILPQAVAARRVEERDAENAVALRALEEKFRKLTKAKRKPAPVAASRGMTTKTVDPPTQQFAVPAYGVIQEAARAEVEEILKDRQLGH